MLASLAGTRSASSEFFLLTERGVEQEKSIKGKTGNGDFFSKNVKKEEEQGKR